MKQYIDLLKTVLNQGVKKQDRTKTGTLSCFGLQAVYDLSTSFPLLTTKKVYWKGIIFELLWFLKGATNIRSLVQNNVNIWNEWPYQKYRNSSEYQNETIAEFAMKIANEDVFAKKYGELGPVYGKQWRSFGHVDQIKVLETNLKNNPSSRRHIVSAWNVSQLKDMLLPPCHLLFQFYVSEGNKLSCALYQRSADLFLGVPFNIASYSTLTCMLADALGFIPDKFIHFLGDVHIYLNHLSAVEILLERQPKKLPQLLFKNHHKSVLDYCYNDFDLIGYNPHPAIKAAVSV